MLLRFLLRALVAALGLWLAQKFVPGIVVTDLKTLLIAGLLLGLVNAFVRPVVVLLTLPLTLLTLGLFLLVINAAMLELVAWLLDGFAIHGLVAALLGAVVVTIVSWIGSWFIHRPRPG